MATNTKTTDYQLHLKGFVGGYDFDADYVDYILNKNKDSEVHVLIDSLGGRSNTALSIFSAFKRHGNVNVHFVGMNASAATIASLGIDEDTFDRIMEYADMDDDDRDAFDEFSEAFGNDCVASFKERYMGQWDSEKDFAEHIVDECYNLDDMMGHLASYFDYEAYARDLFIDDFYFSNGYVFRR
jgi:hypothetical protein